MKNTNRIKKHIENMLEIEDTAIKDLLLEKIAGRLTNDGIKKSYKHSTRAQLLREIIKMFN